MRESRSLLDACRDQFCPVTRAIVLSKKFQCCKISRENALIDLHVSLYLLGSVCATLGLHYLSVQVKVIRKFSYNITGIEE